MKKYLMTGIAALALCVGFTSCSHDIETYSQEELNEMNAQKIVKNYEKAFEATFGKPAANQNWGFGATPTTRTRTENKNLNEWGDPTKGNWIVPDALTDGQKIRVMAYFQANPGLTYEDPQLTNFFIQQVYKGGTTPGAISSEQYTQTNGTPLIGSDNMDYLYMGTGFDHVNDYNNGTWNLGTPYEVLNTGADANKHKGNTTHVEGVTHPDMITLMENSSTEYVAFGSSTGNQYHTDCCALAGWRVIEAWAIAHRDSLVDINKYGDTLDDGWERSFVGLDYENRTVEGLYTNPKTNAKALDNNFIDGNSHWVLYQGTIYSFDDFRNNIGNFDFRDTKGDLVYYVTDNVSNQAIADYIKYTKSDGTVGNVTKDAYNYKLSKQQFKDLYNVDIANQEDGLYNLDMILGYIRQSALPTQNNGNWVKNIGGRDYVFSDWIVTLTEAKKQTTVVPTTYTLRVMAEDLSADEASDFDFNDVVFDVAWTTGTTQATITLQAAGGTLPLRINQDDTKEVHLLFGVQTNVMVNTGWSGAQGDSKPAVSFPINNFSPTDSDNDGKITQAEFNAAVNGIMIEVEKVVNSTTGEKQWFELFATQGVACCKFGCSPDKDWVGERTNIDDVYTFSEWVQGFTTTLTLRSNQ